MTKSITNFIIQTGKFIIILIIISFTSVNAFAAEPTDISDHWAKDIIQNSINNGLARGYLDGTFRPDNNITRAEFMSLVNGIFEYTQVTEVNYSDVNIAEWYAYTVSVAKAAGYITGYPDNTMRPDSPISREEAAMIIMTLNNIEGNSQGINKFADKGLFFWSMDAVGAVSIANIMKGYPDGNFVPQNFIKRGEAVAALDKAHSYGKNNIIYRAEGTYGPETGVLNVDGNVIVTEKGTILQNMVISGNLIVNKSVGDGNVYLKNIVVKGDTLIYGGGENGVAAFNSKFSTVNIAKKVGSISFLISGTTTVEMVIAESNIKLEEEDMIGENVGFVNVRFEGQPQNTLTLIGSFGNVDINNPNMMVKIPNGTTVDSMCLNQRTDVTGDGIVTLANIFVDGSTFEVTPKTIRIIEGVISATIGKLESEVVQTNIDKVGGSSGIAFVIPNNKDTKVDSEALLVAEYTKAANASAVVRLLDENALKLTLTNYPGLDVTGKTEVASAMVVVNIFADKAAVQLAVTIAIANAKGASDSRIANAEAKAATDKAAEQTKIEAARTINVKNSIELIAASTNANIYNIILDNDIVLGATLDLSNNSKNINLNAFHLTVAGNPILVCSNDSKLINGYIIGAVIIGGEGKNFVVENVEIVGALTTCNTSPIEDNITFLNGSVSLAITSTNPAKLYDGTTLTAAIAPSTGAKFKNLTITGAVTANLEASYENVIFTGAVTSSVEVSRFKNCAFNGAVTNLSGESDYSGSTFNAAATNTAGNALYRSCIFNGPLTNTAGDADYSNSIINGALTKSGGNATYPN